MNYFVKNINIESSIPALKLPLHDSLNFQGYESGAHLDRVDIWKGARPLEEIDVQG